MSDLVTRLRNYTACNDADIDEAANEIERLQSQLVKSTEALKEIMKIYVEAPGAASPTPDGGIMWKMAQVAHMALSDEKGN